MLGDLDLFQRKAFYRQRIPECNCAKKETIDIDNLETSWNSYRQNGAINQNEELFLGKF